MTSSSQADATATNRLLGFGVLAGPLYLLVGIAQALVRDGFVFARHPLSVLANGPGGWVQTANFIVTGLMVIAVAVGFRRALAPRSLAVSLFLGAFGASMLVAAVFRADPMDGFPVGTPNGPPTTISTSGLVHFAAGGLGFVSLAASCLVAAWVMWRRHVPSLARLSLLAGIIILLGFFGGMAVPGSSPVLGIWIAVVVGWAWLAVMSRHLLKDPNSPSSQLPDSSRPDLRGLAAQTKGETEGADHPDRSAAPRAPLATTPVEE